MKHVLEFKEGWIHGVVKWLCYILSSGGLAEERVFQKSVAEVRGKLIKSCSSVWNVFPVSRQNLFQGIGET